MVEITNKEEDRIRKSIRPYIKRLLIFNGILIHFFKTAYNLIPVKVFRDKRAAILTHIYCKIGVAEQHFGTFAQLVCSFL